MKNLFSERFSELLSQHLWSYEELAKKLGLKSKGTITKYAKGDIKNVNLSMISKIAHLYHVSPIWLLGLQEDKYEHLDTKNEYSLIPLLNSNIEEGPDNIIVAKDFLSSNNYTAFRCEDSSMSPFINPTDLLLVELSSNFNDGDICLLSKENHFYIRRVEKEQDNITFTALNPDYPNTTYSIHELDLNHIHIMGIIKKLERTNF